MLSIQLGYPYIPSAVIAELNKRVYEAKEINNP